MLPSSYSARDSCASHGRGHRVALGVHRAESGTHESEAAEFDSGREGTIGSGEATGDRDGSADSEADTRPSDLLGDLTRGASEGTGSLIEGDWQAWEGRKPSDLRSGNNGELAWTGNARHYLVHRDRRDERAPGTGRRDGGRQGPCSDKRGGRRRWRRRRLRTLRYANDGPPAREAGYELSRGACLSRQRKVSSHTRITFVPLVALRPLLVPAELDVRLEQAVRWCLLLPHQIDQARQGHVAGGEHFGGGRLGADRLGHHVPEGRHAESDQDTGDALPDRFHGRLLSQLERCSG